MAPKSVFVDDLPLGGLGVPDAVTEVNDEADARPEDETQPGVGRQARHHRPAREHAERRGDPDGRRAEGTLRLGRLHAKNENAQADDDEGKDEDDDDNDEDDNNYSDEDDSLVSRRAKDAPSTMNAVIVECRNGDRLLVID